MKKCLILSKLKESDEKHNVGFWILVEKSEEDAAIAKLGSKFIFSFELDEQTDNPLIEKL